MPRTTAEEHDHRIECEETLEQQLERLLLLLRSGSKDDYELLADTCADVQSAMAHYVRSTIKCAWDDGRTVGLNAQINP